MREIKELKKRLNSRTFTYLDKDDYTLDVVLEWTPEDGIKSYIETLEFDLSTEQIENIMQLVAEEAYKMGLEDRR